MNQNVKIAWLEALRSGEYKQFQGNLCFVDANGNAKWCCLGVLTDLAEKAGIVERGDGDSARGGILVGWKVSEHHSEYSVLPPAVVEWAGLSESNPEVHFGVQDWSLSELNDGEWNDTLTSMPFSQIADIIEEQL